MTKHAYVHRYYILLLLLLIFTLVLSFSFASNNFATQDGIEESTAAPTYTSGSWTSSSSRYATSFAGGNGTPSDPWQISTAAQLARMAYYVNSATYNKDYGDAHYVVTNNIDMRQNYWSSIETESYPL